MTAFIKSDLRQTVDYGASFNQYLFDILSKLVDKSNEQGEEVERVRTILHEQGREIDQLKQENKDQKRRIGHLEALLEEEVNQRKGDYETFTVTIETEVEERIFHDRKITTVVNNDRDINNTNLFNLRDDMDRETEMLRRCLADHMSIYFNAYRDGAYDRGGEEILKYDGVTLNAGKALNPATGVFTCPVRGTYLFTINLATHKEKKALISLRRNGQDMASIIAQDGKNKGNHMMGQSVLLDLDISDEVYVYTFTGTWTADWPHIHFTQFIGILLRPENLNSNKEARSNQRN